MIKLCCETCHYVPEDEEVFVNLQMEVEGIKSSLVGLRCPKCKDYKCAVIFSREFAKEKEKGNGK